MQRDIRFGPGSGCRGGLCYDEREHCGEELGETHRLESCEMCWCKNGLGREGREGLLL